MLEALLQNVTLAKGLRSNSAATTQPQGVRDMTAERAMRSDPGMRALTQRRKELETQLDNLLHGTNPMGDASPVVITKRREIEQVKRDIAEYEEQFKDVQLEVIDNLGIGLAGTDLDKQEAVINAMKAERSRELASLNLANDELARLKLQAQKHREEVEIYERKISTLQVEGSIGGRLNVLSPGEIPLRPFYNPRKKMAVAAAMVGGAVPVALLVLLGLASGKYRFVNETELDVARSAPLLGLIPTLPDKLKNMRQIADAAHSVHQIRVMLQMGQRVKGRGVYMVTSSTAGEGKTNLTVALGLSFAAAGCKTLVVDCDLVGQGITRGFRAERTTGLREALDCGSARGFVKKLPQGLRVLTAGNADTLNGWTLSSTATNRMLSEVRRYYDVVLIDTGPILGSVEAAVLAPAVDGVIMTIARGQQRGLVDRAMQHLSSLGAEPVGFVFNRAQSQDTKHTSYYASKSQYSSRGTGNLPQPRFDDTSEVAAFGPLVRSVATLMRVPSDDAD
jgi:capsular exopolysaccharide synthesis family protein